jgi:MerR family copper efflux transcriptional regulator
MHIGELAELTGLSLRTLRHYDEVGLVVASGRTEGGFRLYTHGEVERLMLIRRMKPLGYSLEEMTELLRVIDAHAAGEGVSTHNAPTVEWFLVRARERREALHEQLGMADEFIEILKRQRF